MPEPERTGRGRSTPVEQWVQYLMVRRNGGSIYRAAMDSGISDQSARRAENGTHTQNYNKAVELVELVGVSNIPPYNLLPEEVQAAHDSIAVFALRYFGIILMPWQIEATDTILRLLDSPDEEYICINAPPGSGKSTFFAKVLPAFATCRNRAIRGLIGSHTQKTSEWYTRRLRAEFEREHVVRAELNDEKLGLAVDGIQTMQHDFGQFKPDAKEIWTVSAFTVMQPDDQPLSQKEPTWSAFGSDSGFLGGRFDLVIWDDVWDPRKMRNSESRSDLYRWWDEVAETRLEPGGLLVLNGQRMASDDIYRYAMDKVAPIDDDDLDDPLVEEGAAEEGMVSNEKLERATPLPSETPSSAATSDVPGQENKYHTLKYKAHYEDLCTGTHRRGAPAWPEGCLLYPSRLPWKKLRHIKSQTPDRYEILYQQEDDDPAQMLVDPLWISGGMGRDGVEHVGCWDNDRDLWELPRHMDSDPMIIATADPSPSQFWALQCWAAAGPDEYRYLLESYRQKMDAPTFLDWNHSEQMFTGIAEEWWQKSADMGRPITHWIVEVNAAQKFILQYDHFKRWSAKRGVELVPHYTSRNKGDPKYGVQMLAPLYRHGRIRLPGKQGTAARIHSLLLINEVTKWNPEGTGSRTDDCVMAQWFLEHNLERLYTPSIESPLQQRPSWMLD
jgi:hypothetical protein